MFLLPTYYSLAALETRTYSCKFAYSALLANNIQAS